MGTQMMIPLFSLLILCFFSCFSFADFNPPDNYLINCGSNSNSTIENRVFIGDLTKPRFLSIDSSTKSSPISVSDSNPSSNSPSIYRTARVFLGGSTTYSFSITKSGIHLVRLHFLPFNSQNYNLSSAVFGVSVNGYLLFHGFKPSKLSLREFILKLNTEKLEIVFTPDNGEMSFGFVNAIEVISAPDNLVLDYGVMSLENNGLKEYKNLSLQILESVHRVNVGGLKLTPFNDSLWRTWIPDDDFLLLNSAAKKVNSNHAPNYKLSGASREIAPGNVYMTAQEMNLDNATAYADFNISWSFPVVDHGLYLVRLHFCDIVSIGLNQLYFNVFINGMMAYRDLDLSALTFHTLASPYYLDFIVRMDHSGPIQVSVGPSSLSTSLKKNAILNGVEVMKMVNSEFTGSSWSKKRNLWVILGCVLGGVGFLSIVVVAVLLVFKCKKKPKPAPESVGWTPLRATAGSMYSRVTEGSSSPHRNGLKIPFEEIQFATNNFDRTLIIGTGGFGMVFKGVLRDGTKVAVKRSMPGSRQGLPEFQTEISVLSKIRHRHLVSMVGYCEEQSEMILAYEYVEKGPLKKHLYGGKSPPLSWKQRLDICIGAARGLHYLHTGFAQGIIHRDVKSTNILLDESYVAKVADFGLSRSGPHLDQTHVSTGVKGSFGYLDPEYFRRQQLTDKSDVYSFGVVLLEVLCARPAVDPLLTREQVNLAEWALEFQKQGLITEIVDPHLKDHIKPSSLKKFGDTAQKCLAEYGADRPTMGDVLWNLEHALQLQEGQNMTETDDTSDTFTTEVSVTRVVPDAPTTVIPVGETSNENLGKLSTSDVFSQLVTNEGR